MKYWRNWWHIFLSIYLFLYLSTSVSFSLSLCLKHTHTHTHISFLSCTQFREKTNKYIEKCFDCSARSSTCFENFMLKKMTDTLQCFLCTTQSSDIECPHGCGTLACCKRHLKVHLGGATNGSVASSHCRPFRIDNSTTFGRHLVATRDIVPLEEILNEKVAVLGPATKSPPICLECLKPVVQGKFVHTFETD